MRATVDAAEKERRAIGFAENSEGEREGGREASKDKEHARRNHKEKAGGLGGETVMRSTKKERWRAAKNNNEAEEMTWLMKADAVWQLRHRGHLRSASRQPRLLPHSPVTTSPRSSIAVLSKDRHGSTV